ncbi:hypothetical protein [Streptomyces sp. NBC_01506]|uniref:hypothetical protein n=1 Tax=Streptomyces sp. NBC_01506 TaxID=2903887 RepID=UPI003868767C
METDQGPWTARGRSSEREGQLRTCLPARLTIREGESGSDGQGRQEMVDQDWNVVRGED